MQARRRAIELERERKAALMPTLFAKGTRGEWARDDDGDGVREVHCNTSEGAHAALRTFLRTFRGVHKAYLACYLAVYEAIRNVKRITPEIVQRLCFGKSLHTSCT